MTTRLTSNTPGTPFGQPHDGTIILQLVGDPVEKLKGTYWTSRSTTGEVTLTFREKKRLEEFPADLGAHPVSGRA